VSYNSYLLCLFNCHINVEACGSIKAVKYLFKYIYKGHDRVVVAVREDDKDKNGNGVGSNRVECLGTQIHPEHRFRWKFIPKTKTCGYPKPDGLTKTRGYFNKLARTTIQNMINN
jgi:hypothetical protein